MMSMEHKNRSVHVQNKHKKGRRLHCANYARNLHLYSCKIQIAHRELSADQVLSVKNTLLRKNYQVIKKWNREGELSRGLIKLQVWNNTLISKICSFIFRSALVHFYVVVWQEVILFCSLSAENAVNKICPRT